MTTLTCTTPFVGGGQIPQLVLSWTAATGLTQTLGLGQVAQPAVTGTAVLEQGGTPVSNTATF
ncbi:hypothetical protein [Sinomonas sp. G460-2]|uniref:hypothetical protein n=1 Tax=Sinomonas sp. G460-2 TaxID=3393464 RepID=UPI0039EF8FCC